LNAPLAATRPTVAPRAAPRATAAIIAKLLENNFPAGHALRDQRTATLNALGISETGVFIKSNSNSNSNNNSNNNSDISSNSNSSSTGNHCSHIYGSNMARQAG